MPKKIKKPPLTGALLLAAVSLGLVMVLSLNSFREMILPFSFDNQWVTISDLSLSTYNKSWVNLVVFEFIISIVQIIGLIIILILFSNKSNKFPVSLIIFVMLKILLYTLVYYFHTVIKGPPTPTLQIMVGSNFKAILLAAVWIPYFMLSEKVNDLFIY